MFISTIAAGVGILGGVNSLMNSGGSSSSGNVAGGALYDPYASSRGQAGTELNSLIYGTPATPAGTSSSGQTYQQYVQSLQPQGGRNSNYVQNYGMDAMFGGGSGGGSVGGTPMSQADWNKQNPGKAAGTPMDMITNMPGYQFQQQAGMDAVNRTAAASGQSLGGNQQIALQNQGTSNASAFYNQMVGNLMTMSGAGSGPSNVTGQNQLNANQQGQAQSGIMQGLGSLNNIFNTGSNPSTNTATPANYGPSGYVNGTSSYYTTTDTNISPWGNAPANFGGGTAGPGL